MAPKRPTRFLALWMIGLRSSPLALECPRRSWATSRLSGAVLLAVVTLLVTTACSQGPEVKKQRALERGQQYVKVGKLNEAIIEFRNALQVDPEFAPALRALGLAYADKSWFGDAYRELSRAQKLSPDSVPIAIDLGKVLIELGDWSEAENQVTRILAQDPQAPQALTIRAGALLGRGKLEEALAILKAAPPGSIPEAERIHGDVLLMARKLDKAEAIYKTVLATKPGDLKSLLGLGAIGLQRRKLDEAKNFYGQAKASHPLDPRAPVGLAATMAQQGNLEDAIKELEEIDLPAQTLWTLLVLGQYYLQANRPGDAVRLLRLLVVQFPQSPDARYLLATSLALSGDPAAVEQFEELDRQLPNNPVVQLRLASAYTQQGRPRDALAQLDRIAKQPEKSAAYQLERGRALFFLGRLDEAFAAGSAAQRLAPQMPQPYMLMGQVLTQRGNLKDAEEKFTRAAEVDASFVPAHLAVGQLHLAAKNVNAALKDLDAAVRADPNSLAAASAKAIALAQQNRRKDAILFVEETIKTGKKSPGFSSLLGSLYAADGQRDKAAAIFHRAIEADPKNSPARLGLARLLVIEGKDEEAIAQLQAAIREKPDDIMSVFLLRSLYERLGRLDQAIPVLQAAITANPRQILFGLALSDVDIRVGHYDDALGRTSELLASQRDLAIARLIRGQAYLAKGDAEGALKDYQEAIRSDPKSARARFYLAQVYTLLGRKQEAEAEYREAIKLEPAFGPAKRGLAILRGEKPDERSQQQEIDQLRDVTKADPKNVAARAVLARAYFGRAQMKEAEAELRQLLELAPKLPEPNFQLAQILLAQGKEEEAANYLRAALRGNPAHVGSNVLLARYLASKGQREQAMPLLQTALSVNPNLPDAQFLLANLYAQSGRLPEALSLAKDLQRVEAKSARPWVLTGAVLVAQQNPRGAIDSFEKALKIDVNSVEAHRGLGQAYRLLGQNDRAEPSFRRALALNGNDVTSLNDLAWILSEIKKKPDEALPLAMKAERLAPQLAWVIDTLGWIHYRRQSYADAEKILTQAAERAPSNGVVRFHLGMTYAKLGRTNDAVSALRRAAQLDPKLADRENIEQLIKDLGS